MGFRNMPGGEEVAVEQRLIDRCLAGDAPAWQALYRGYHARLRNGIGRWVVSGRPELADEIAARVWCSLVFHDGRRLKAYDSRRGSLRAYLLALAFGDMRRLFRREATAPPARCPSSMPNRRSRAPLSCR